MDHQDIARNVRRLRQVNRQSQKELATAAGLSLAGFRKIETGMAQPRVDSLQSIARALKVGLQELLTPAPELRSVRFRSFKRLRTREHILTQVASWLRDFNELETILGVRLPYALQGLTAPDSPEEAAQRVRKKFGLSPTEPIRDLCGLLESRAVKVLLADIASDAFFGLSVSSSDGGPAIVVNTWDRISVERQIFTAAHELGHLVLHLGEYDVDQQEEEKLQEQEANLFASHFLMPNAAFEREWQDTYGLGFIERVFKVKRIFRVSYRTVLYRLVESTEDKDLWRKFQVFYKKRYGKTLLKRDEPSALAANAFRAATPEASREPAGLSSDDFVEDRLSRLVRRAVEQGEISLSRAAEILNLSLEEMRELSAAWVA